MIPDFKTYIGESVWADIHRRSNGKTLRKEDSVDLLSPEDFVIYLKTHYRVDNSPYDFVFNEDTNTLSLPIYVYNETQQIRQLGVLFFDYNDNCTYIHKRTKKQAPKLYSKLENDFDLWDDDPEYKHYIIINPLDKDRTPNNSYVIELLEYIIKNIDEELTQVLSKKSKITESVWSDIHKRSNGESVRKEDEIGNIRSLKPIDMGGSVLWADQNLIYDGDELFTFHEAYELINGSDWRLPTREEIAELDGHNIYYDAHYIYLDDDKKISFKKCGCRYTPPGNSFTIDSGKVFYGWTSEPYKYSANDIHVLVIDEFSINYSALDKTINNQVTQNADTKCCIRLVKDK